MSTTWRRRVEFGCLAIALLGAIPLLDLATAPVILAFAEESPQFVGTNLPSWVKYLDLIIRLAALLIAWLTKPREEPPIP